MSTPSERADHGKARRKAVPRSSHGAWVPSADRPDPVAVLERQAEGRVRELVPIRYGRMAASRFAFLRGAAAVMAADLAALPHTGLTVQLCGDAHLLNFGLYASPERALLFGVNDFDETLPGPFEWDLKRLAASLAVAALDNGHDGNDARRAAVASAQAYRETVRALAEKGELDVWYARVDTADAEAVVKRGYRKRVDATLEKARRRTSMQAFGKLTESVDGRRRIISDPPLIEPVGTADRATVRKFFADYRSTLPEDRRRLLDRFQVADVARKVVGVGSVGTRCFIVLLNGRDTGDPLFLQVKEAGRSVLETGVTPSRYSHQGQRVVAGQLLFQSASDIFLGWVSGPKGRHFYWRQLRDMKGSADVDSMTPDMLRRYARLCGTTLADAHARTGDRIAIASYLGGSDVFDRAIGEFALRYSDRNTADHRALTAAIASGAVAATAGV
jgi:uncharacterized protein (DUF2252 family)